MRGIDAQQLARQAGRLRWLHRHGSTVEEVTELRSRIRAALEADPSVPDAAATLGIGTSTLHRWLAEQPDLRNGFAMRQPGNPVLLEQAMSKAREARASVARKKPSR